MINKSNIHSEKLLCLLLTWSKCQSKKKKKKSLCQIRSLTPCEIGHLGTNLAKESDTISLPEPGMGLLYWKTVSSSLLIHNVLAHSSTICPNIFISNEA